jgi:hypothetical protein
LADLPIEISSLISEFGEEQFFVALGHVVASLTTREITTEVAWDEICGWMNVTESLIGDWEKRFPRVNIRGELSKAHGWLLANPKNRKRRYRRFLESWLSRCEKSSRAYGGGYKAAETGGGF